MESVRVPGFLPSTSGLRFANRYPPAPFWRLRFRNLVAVELGNVSNGLCGGMTFVAADLHAAGAPRPESMEAPADGDPLRDAIKRRQVDSFDRGRLPLRFYLLGLSFRPRRERPVPRLGPLEFGLHSRTWIMVKDEWPAIRRRLDAGRLVPLGLVRRVSLSPLDLVFDHQVLAYGYDLDGMALTLRIYDPNWPGDDTVTITFDVADPAGEATPTYSTGEPLAAFFRAPWRPAPAQARAQNPA